jgi:hypothetical protein
MAVTHQADLVIREDLTPYAGSWVAIRDGKWWQARSTRSSCA